MSEVPITGLASSDPVPGIYVDLQFAQGDASAASGAYSAILMGNRLSSGSGSDNVIYGPDTATPMLSSDDAASLFGAGSELHCMARRFFARNKATPLYAIAVAESAGTQADGYIALTTSAAANGELEMWIQDVRVSSPIVSGDTVSTIAANAVVALSAHTELPVTFTQVAGSVWVRAKQKGPRGNNIRISARVIGVGVGTTVTPTSATALSSGATADDVTSALAVILPEHFYYIVPAHVDATNLGLIQAQIASNAVPTTGIRQRMIAGSADTNANAITVAQGLNFPRCELVWSWEADLTPGELAAVAVACYSLEELNFGQASTALNFDHYGFGVANQEKWGLSAPRSGRKPTRSQISAALAAGVTPVEVMKGRCGITKAITTYSSNNSVADYRARPRHVVTVCDRYGDDFIAMAAAKFPNKTLGDDPSDGDIIPSDQVTPRMLKAAVDKLTSDYGKLGLVGNVAQIKAATIVSRSQLNNERMSARVPLHVIDLLGQVCLRLDQTA